MTTAADSYPPRRARLLTAATALAAVAAAALILVACASPAGIAPSAKTLDSASLTPGGTQTPEVASDWWKAYGDPALDELVERTLRDSPTLATAQARVHLAQAAVDANRAAQGPDVGAGFDATRERFPEKSLYPPPLGGSYQTMSTLQLSGTWEIDIFGRQRAALEAALGTERAAEADAQAARLLLATNVVREYVLLARDVEQRDVQQRTLAQRSEVLSIIRQRVDAGLDTNVELRLGEGNLPESRQRIEFLNEQMALTRHALAALSGQGPNALDALTPHLNTVQLVPLPDNVPADLLGRRPDITAARWRIEAATQDMQSARAEFYPSVNLIAFAGWSAIGLENLLQAGSRQFGIGPAIRLPIFDSGRLRANLSGKAVDVDAAVAAYNGAVLEALHDVADPIASLQSIARQQIEQAQAQASAESAYDLAIQRYRAGLGTYLIVLNAEDNVLTQRRSGVDLKARALDAQAQLSRALGGGYAPDRLPATLALATPSGTPAAAK
jgi:NodT family efflux transporter outer membrane factor (OMF) lipoprotein